MYPSETDPWTTLVARVLRIESVTLGDRTDKTHKYLARYSGRLLQKDSEAAYERLANSLRPHQVTPLFRTEGDQHLVILIPALPDPKPSKLWVNILLFTLTVASVLLAGLVMSYQYIFEQPLLDFSLLLAHLPIISGMALGFTASLLGILLAHEFGHYLVARFHKTAATLPYFIPFPLSPLGTMGAVIVQKESHRNKRILLDIGIAGPLAGLVVAIPVVLLGLSLSELNPIPQSFPPGQGISLEGNSILYLLSKYAIFGHWLPEPGSYQNVHPLVYWIQYYFTGQPTPLGGLDVSLHPVAFAGWAGLLVTALNLIPAGQLDGGHIMHSLMGRKASLLLPFVLVTLLGLGIFWQGWWLWAFLIFFMGRAHAEPLDQITPLDNRRKLLAVLAMLLFILVFTPVPLRIVF
jgi:membrane-associated protease RseP (regulator of RpoE activity)